MGPKAHKKQKTKNDYANCYNINNRSEREVSDSYGDFVVGKQMGQ